MEMHGSILFDFKFYFKARSIKNNHLLYIVHYYKSFPPVYSFKIRFPLILI